MVIVCGMDDSAPSWQAARAAAAVAKRAGEALELVHVQELYWLNPALVPDMAPGGLPVNQALLDAERERMQGVLKSVRDALVREYKVQVGVRVECGFPEHELSRCAQTLGASLLVVGAIGRRSGSRWRLGGIPDRLAQVATVPVLVVRGPYGLSRWSLEDRALRVVVALGKGPSSARAGELAAELARLGPCEVVEAHVYDPKREARRLGLESAGEAEARVLIEQALARELPRAGGEGPGAPRFVALPGQGHVAEALSELVERERADLVVVGSRGRGALERRFLGSVSYGLLGLSNVSVLVARQGAAPEERKQRAPVAVRRILAATDFSESGNRAVDYAVTLMPKGGQLTLLHVLERPVSADMVPIPDPLAVGREERRMNRALAEAELRKLLQPEHGVFEAEVESVEAAAVPEAILQAAERHDADLVVLGRRGHGGLAAALLGSSARAVARSSPRPVLLVPEEQEEAS